MNAKRRAEIETAREHVDQARYMLALARDAERAYFEAMPQGVRRGAKGEKALAAAAALNNSVRLLDATGAELDAAIA